MEKTRSMIFDSGMKKEMWGEAVYAAAHLLNRLPTTTVDTTPFEKWNKTRPDLGKIHIFGSKAYAKKLGSLKKLDERSKTYTMVGYAPVGYRLWDSEKRKIIIARDVKFEDWTPTKHKNQKKNNLKQTLYKDENEISEEEETIQEENENETLKKEEILQEENEEETEDLEERDLLDETVYEKAIEERNEIDNESQEKTFRKSERKRKTPKRYENFTMLTYKQAVSGNNQHNWKMAINDEMDSLKENGIWDLADASSVKDIKPLSRCWVFRVKENGNYKARPNPDQTQRKNHLEIIRHIYKEISKIRLLLLFVSKLIGNHHELVLIVFKGWYQERRKCKTYQTRVYTRSISRVTRAAQCRLRLSEVIRRAEFTYIRLVQ